MASTKTGKITDTAAPPFATRNGAPASPGTQTRPTDFARDASSAAQRAQTPRGTDFTRGDGRSQAPPPDEVQPDQWPSRVQAQGSPEGRVDPGSVAPGGTVTRADPASTRGGIVDAGPTPRSPFRNMK